MDRDYQRLVRAVKADPLNRELLDHYGRVSRRMGWRCHGRFIEQYVEDLYLNDPGFSYEQGENRATFYQPSYLRRYGELGARIVFDVTKALGHDSAKVRWNAAAALSFIGPAADMAIPDLIELLEDPEPIVQRVAAWALRARSEKAIPALIHCLETQLEKAPALCFALTFMGKKAESALPVLETLMATDIGADNSFLSKTRTRLLDTGPERPQSIQGVKVNFDLESCESQDDFEWISFCSEIYGIENSLPRYSYGRTYFDPERPVSRDPIVSLSIFTPSCSSEARVYLRDGRAWKDHGILVQDIGNSYRVYIRVTSEQGPYLTQSDLMYQAFQAFRKHCSGNLWTNFDRFERYHGFGPDEKTVYQLMLE